MWKIEMLPAAHGDAIWVEYGTGEGDVNRIIIDGGPHHTYGALRSRILSLPPKARDFELLVITHVDADHIDGIIKLLQDDVLGATFKDVWFNGWKHIEGRQLGGKEGEFLGALLAEDKLKWNDAFNEDAILVDTDGVLPVVTLKGGMKLTIVSPGDDQLTKLRKEWEKAVIAAGFVPGDRKKALEQLRSRKVLDPSGMPLGDKDDSVANGASIAFVAEYGDQSCLFTGDAHEDVLAEHLHTLAGGPDKRVKVDAFKLPHHGSINNMSPGLLKAVDARQYLVSSSGAIFHHPNKETIELIRVHHTRGKPRFRFNYRSDSTEPYADEQAQEDGGYEATFPEGLAVSV